ncbi:MAG: TIGR00725 family protein [Candidatus Binataceae bacterium]
MAQRVIAVIGAGAARIETCELAFAVGRAVAERGATLICGGRGGVMEAAARGARAAGGHTIGILPGYDRRDANPHIEFAIATGMGQARNAIIIASADAVVALEGEGGTLSEIGLALKLGRPLVALRAWPEIAGIAHADDPASAVELALARAASSPPLK